MTALAIVLDVALATVFVVAALGKISDWGAWRSALARLGLVALDNDTVAGGVIGMELVCAALLVAGLVPAAGALSAVLFGAFALTLVVAYARGARGECHCFGAVAPTRVGPTAVGRALLLTIAAIAAALLPRDPSDVPVALAGTLVLGVSIPLMAGARRLLA